MVIKLKKSELDINKVLELYAQTKSSKKVAKEIGCSDFLIKETLKDEGVELRKSSKPLNEETTDEIVALYEKKIPVTKISKKFNIAVPTVYKKLKERKIERRNLEVNIPLDEIKEMRKKGLTFKDIGNKFGCSGECVRRKVIQANLETSPKSKFSREEILRMDKEGNSLGTIARTLGCSKATVQNRLKEKL